MSSKHHGYWVIVPGVALAYFAFAWFARLTGMQLGQPVPLFWPSAGVALAATLLLGVRAVPGVALGCLAISWQARMPVNMIAFVTLGATLASLLGLLILGGMSGFRKQFLRGLDIIALIIFAPVIALISSGAYAFGLYHSGMSGHGLFVLWLRVWIAESAGLVFATPALFMMGAALLGGRKLRCTREAALYMVLFVGVLFLIFGGTLDRLMREHALIFVALPFIMLIALRVGFTATAAASLVLALVAVAGTTHDLGPFLGGPIERLTVIFWIYLGVIGVTGLLVAALTSEATEAAEQLADREERLRNIFQNSNDGILLIDPREDRILEANPAAGAVLGYDPQVLLSTPMASLHASMDRMVAFTEQVLKQGRAMTDDLFCKRSDGNLVPVEISAAHIAYRGRDCIICMVRDITLRRAQEARLERMMEILQATSDFVAVANPTGDVVFINQAGRDMLGLPEDFDAQGTPITEHLADVSARRIFDKLPEAAAQGVHRVESEFISAAGKHIPVSQVIIGHREDGEIAYYSTIARDMSVEKQAEKALQESEERVRKSRDFYLTLLEGFPAMIWRSGTDGRCDYFNTTWLAFTGRSLDEEEGEGWVNGVHREDRESVNQAHQGALEKRAAFGLEFRLRHHSGDHKWVVDHGQPFYDFDGEFAGYIGVCLDISDRKKAEQELHKSNEQLRVLSARIADAQEMERKRIANELHDQVGQAVSALGMNLHYVQALVEGERSDPEEAVQRLRDALVQTEGIAESVRSVMMDLRPSVLDDYGLVSALNWFGEEFGRRTGLTVVVHDTIGQERLSPKVETVLFRVAQEALNNAAKHAEAQGIDVQLDIDHDAETLHLIVHDDGKGLDASAHQKAPNSRGGWGLNIIRERALSVGGTLIIDSTPGKGTDVEVIIPRPYFEAATSSKE